MLDDEKVDAGTRIRVRAFYQNGDLDVEILTKNGSKLYKYCNFSPFLVEKLQKMTQKRNLKAVFSILKRHRKENYVS